MTKSHLKSLVAPKSWNIKAKAAKFVTKPLPGPHKSNISMPVSIFMKNIGHAITTKEVKYILNNQSLLVDGKPVKNHKFPVGLMDVVEIKGVGTFRVLMNSRNRLFALPISPAEASLKPCKIIGKSILKKGRIQLNLSGSRNIIVSKDEFNTNDSVIFDLKENKIKEHFKLEKGAFAYIVFGKHSGSAGVVEDIFKDNVIIKSGTNRLQTLVGDIFIIGRNNPAIAFEVKDESNAEG